MKQYRTAYVTQPTKHSFSPILDLCERVEFITTGYEDDKNLKRIVKNALKNFDPEADVLVPVGSVITNLVVGIEVEKLRQEKNCESVNIAIYHDQKYRIRNVELIEEMEQETDERF